MIEALGRLNEQEQELMLKAPILVSILIAGADGDIDEKEIREAVSVVQSKNLKTQSLKGFAAVMSEDFEDKIKILIQSFPYESTQRNPLIIEELVKLNGLWKKLDADFARDYYQMLKVLAERVASSSGGMLGLKKIAAEEAQYIKLPMLNDPSKS
jgi:hypothetical protein